MSNLLRRDPFCCSVVFAISEEKNLVGRNTRCDVGWMFKRQNPHTGSTYYFGSVCAADGKDLRFGRGVLLRRYAGVVKIQFGKNTGSYTM